MLADWRGALPVGDTPGLDAEREVAVEDGVGRARGAGVGAACADGGPLGHAQTGEVLGIREELVVGAGAGFVDGLVGGDEDVRLDADALPVGACDGTDGLGEGDDGDQVVAQRMGA